MLCMYRVSHIEVNFFYGLFELMTISKSNGKVSKVWVELAHASECHFFAFEIFEYLFGHYYFSSNSSENDNEECKKGKTTKPFEPTWFSQLK